MATNTSGNLCVLDKSFVWGFTDVKCFPKIKMVYWYFNILTKRNQQTKLNPFILFISVYLGNLSEIDADRSFCFAIRRNDLKMFEERLNVDNE